MRQIALLLSCAACVAPRPRDPAACSAPADRVEVEQIQVGWNTFTPAGQPSVVDVARPTRDERQAERIASDLLQQCKKGIPMGPLQDKFSEVPPGSQVLGPNSDVPYKAAALCLQPNECEVVRSKIAFHVLKRTR